MIKDNESKIKAFFRRTAFAYCKVFDKKNNQFSDEVLKDLARFCRAHKSAYHPDARMSAVLEGRREVWLRIQNYLNLSNEELYNLHQVKGGGHE